MLASENRFSEIVLPLTNLKLWWMDKSDENMNKKLYGEVIGFSADVISLIILTAQLYLVLEA